MHELRHLIWFLYRGLETIKSDSKYKMRRSHTTNTMRQTSAHCLKLMLLLNVPYLPVLAEQKLCCRLWDNAVIIDIKHYMQHYVKTQDWDNCLSYLSVGYSRHL